MRPLNGLALLTAMLHAPPPPPSADPQRLPDTRTWTGSVRGHGAAVQEYIAAGDIYQANLSQRFSAPTAGGTLCISMTSSGGQPSPFAAYAEFGDMTLVSSSPDGFRLRGRTADTVPLQAPDEEARTARARDLTAELLRTRRRRAEHIMLLDLSGTTRESAITGACRSTSDGRRGLFPCDPHRLERPRALTGEGRPGAGPCRCSGRHDHRRAPGAVHGDHRWLDPCAGPYTGCSATSATTATWT